MEQKPKLKCEQCYQEITVVESLKRKCPRLLDLLQTPLTPETLVEAKERKGEDGKKNKSRKGEPGKKKENERRKRK